MEQFFGEQVIAGQGAMNNSERYTKLRTFCSAKDAAAEALSE